MISFEYHFHDDGFSTTKWPADREQNPKYRYIYIWGSMKRSVHLIFPGNGRRAPGLPEIDSVAKGFLC